MKELKNLRELGLAIRDARRAAGLTQLQLAEKAHVSRRWLIAIETGDAQAPDATKIFDTLRALNLRFGLSSSEETAPDAAKSRPRPLTPSTRSALRRMRQRS